MYTQAPAKTRSSSPAMSVYPNTGSIITMKELSQKNGKYEKAAESMQKEAQNYKTQEQSTDGMFILLLLLLFMDCDKNANSLLPIITLLLMS